MASEIHFPVCLLHRKVAPGAILTEPLFVPEIARLGRSRIDTVRATTKVLQKFLARCVPSELIRRRRATTAREHAFTLVLDPPRASRTWREPVELKLHAVLWDHEGYVLARIPALGIEAIATARDDLDEVLRRESLSLLRRLNASANLRNLGCYQTTGDFGIEWIDVPVTLRSLKDRAVKSEDESEKKKTVLQEIATRLVAEHLDPAYEVDDAVRLVADSLTARPPQSVLLVGPSGVGKTAIVRELVRRSERFALNDSPVYRTSGSRIVAGQCGFGMWEQRCQELVKDAVKRRAIVHIGSLAELMDVGKSEFNSTGIATFLRPAIARGEFLCIAECTPEQLPLIEKENPQLPDAFRHVVVEEPDQERGKRILAAFAADHRRRVPTAAALWAVDRLHRRYATYSAYPGRPLRFLHNLVRDGVKGEPIRDLDVYSEFTRETGLPREMIDPDEALDLNATRDWIAKRVVGQSEAVEIVVDMLATIKAGLTRTNRPIASLLFIGPTGVGKTEMAKSVAEYLFGAKNRLVRFDMSEYADPDAVRRLVGTGYGTEGLLTARVREQPFGVLLLDEIEKAHPSAFDLLLQVLGEARLTDAGGRLADFRNTVIVLTSNLGAESFRSGTPGFSGRTLPDAKAHFTRAVEQFLRPEMFNRLDRIIPFCSLPPEVIRSIADREWRKVQERDGLRYRPVDLSTGEGLLDHLAAVGFDPRYGARPLKRAMERELLAPLAKQLNRHAGDSPLSVQVGVDAGAPIVTVRPLTGSKAEEAASAPALDDARNAQAQRRWHQLLHASTVVRELENDLTQLAQRERRLIGKQKKGRNLTREIREVMTEAGRLREIRDEVHRQREAITAIEDEALVSFYSGTEHEPLAERLRAADADWDRLLLRLYALNTPKSNWICLHLFAESRLTLADLANGYRAIAREHGIDVECVRYRLPGQQPPILETEKRPAQAHKQHKATHYWHENQYFAKDENPHRLVLWREPLLPTFDPRDTPDVIGFGFRFSGPGAHLRYSAEAGVHLFDPPPRPDADTANAIIFASSDALESFLPDEKFTRKGNIMSGAIRRRYSRSQGSVVDLEWAKIQPGMPTVQTKSDFPTLLAAAVDRTVRVRLMELILE